MENQQPTSEACQEPQVEQPEENSNPDYMERQLATISTITEILPIEGADRLVLARFSTHAYQCVVGKGEFNVGDKCVYYAIDSFLKPDPAYDSILSKNCTKTLHGQAGYRIKTITLRGQLSQGYVIPVPADLKDLPEGTDVTKRLGVKKWVYPVGCKIGKVIGDFPPLIKKSDQTNVQSLDIYHLMRLFEDTFEVTEKIDGTSCTVYCTPKVIGLNISSVDPWPEDVIHIGVCSRNLELAEPNSETKEFYQPLKDGDEVQPGDVIHGGKLCRKIVKTNKLESTYWEVVSKCGLPEALRRWCSCHKRQIAIQGEICGPGIQKNPLELSTLRFFIFDIYDIDNKCYLSAGERAQIIRELEELSPGGREFTIQAVPTIDPSYSFAPTESELRAALETAVRLTSTESDTSPAALWRRFCKDLYLAAVGKLLALAEGKVFTAAPDGTGKSREGIVLKSLESPNSSFKVVNNRMLLEETDND